MFAGDRRDELRRRLAGATYAEIAADGGGIVKTVMATRAASEDELVAGALPRLAAMLACGTTTAEVKSGYGLETAGRTADASRDPHGSPPSSRSSCRRRSWARTKCLVEYRDRRDDYVRLVIDEMIPAVAAEWLAEWCDVFCERGVFTPDESRTHSGGGHRARAGAPRSMPTSSR